MPVRPNFLDKVIFKGDVTFEGVATFNKDTGGLAIVNKDSDHVDITFEKEYTQTPIVNATIALDKISDQNALEDLENAILNGDIRYIVTNRTTKGFTIKLNKAAGQDIQFSWSATSVKDAKTYESTSQSTSSQSPTTSPAQSPQSSPTQSANPSPEQSASPNSSTTPTPSTQ